MTSLILSLFVSLSFVSEHQLKKDIVWQTQKELPNITIKSYYALSSGRIRIIQNEMKSIKRRFNDYYMTNCKPGPLEIRIVKISWLNSSDYFDWVDHRYLVFGRYFKLRNIMYVTSETFSDLYTLDHELTHYMYDECIVYFESDAQEHRQLDRFLKSTN